MSVKRYPEDKAFSDAIRESHDFCCAHCHIDSRHNPGGMHCAHIHSRKHRATRWCSDYGAVALCASCHRRFTDFPLEWAEWLKTHMGIEAYEEAQRLAHTIRKFAPSEKPEIAKHYRAELSRIKKLRLNGTTGFIKLKNYCILES